MEKKSWYENDIFWKKTAPFMFPQSRWESTPDEVDLLEVRLQIQPGSAILDLGCGPGRHSLELARRGHRVTGVDRTAAYLSQAKATADAESLAVEFVQNDIRHFSRPGSYDLAISMFTSFGYFEEPDENYQVLRNVYESLTSGGRFIIETVGKEVLARIFQERDWSEHEGAVLLQEREVTSDWRWMSNRWILIDKSGRFEQHLGHWIYSAAELFAMLTDVGFTEVAAFGNLAGAPYDHLATRLVVVAKK